MIPGYGKSKFVRTEAKQMNGKNRATRFTGIMGWNSGPFLDSAFEA